MALRKPPNPIYPCDVGSGGNSVRTEYFYDGCADGRRVLRVGQGQDRRACAAKRDARQSVSFHVEYVFKAWD